MTSPYYNPEILLLEHDLDKELIQQTIEILRFIYGEDELSPVENKSLNQMFNDTLNKYKDEDALSIEAVKEKIAEQGYSYITEVFTIEDDDLRVFAAYLPLIQLLKGTEPGLRLVFTLLNVNFDLIEWWQDPNNLELMSYILSVELVNQPVKTTLIPRMKEFSRSYVYPLLTHVVYSILYKFGSTPHIGAVVYSKTAITVWQEILWLIWSGDSEPENLWTDQYPYQDPITRKSYWQGDHYTELTWNKTGEEPEKDNTWSGDDQDIRAWEYTNTDEMPTDGELLEWWIEKFNLFGGKDEEHWSTEDNTEENPTLTYWSPDSEEETTTTIVRVTIVATPSNALVEINGELTHSTAVRAGSEVSYKVYTAEEGFISQSGTITPTKDTVLEISLQEVISHSTFTIVATPSNANVIISTSSLSEADETESTSALSSTSSTKVVSKTVETGTTLYWRVYADNYISQSGSVELVRTLIEQVNLEKIPTYTFHINPTPSDATVRINAQNTNTISAQVGSKVTWSVSADHYTSQSGSEVLDKDISMDVELEPVQYTVSVAPVQKMASIEFSYEDGANVETGDTFVKGIYGTYITYHAVPEDTEKYRDLYGTLTIEGNSTLKLTFEEKELVEYTETETLFEHTNTARNPETGYLPDGENALMSGIFTSGKQYIGSDEDEETTETPTWEAGKGLYAVAGPCTVSLTGTSTSSSSLVTRSAAEITVLYGESEDTAIEYTQEGSITNAFKTLTLDIPEGQYLFYGEAKATYQASDSEDTVSAHLISVGIKCTATRTYTKLE